MQVYSIVVDVITKQVRCFPDYSPYRWAAYVALDPKTG
jgi:hypothetical protein